MTEVLINVNSLIPVCFSLIQPINSFHQFNQHSKPQFEFDFIDGLIWLIKQNRNWNIITVLDCTNRYCNDLGWSVVRCEKPIEHRYILFSFHVRYYCYHNPEAIHSSIPFNSIKQLINQAAIDLINADWMNWELIEWIKASVYVTFESMPVY